MQAIADAQEFLWLLLREYKKVTACMHWEITDFAN